VQELHKERSNGSSGENEDDAGDPSRLAVYESEDLSQVIQNPFTVRRRMTSGIKRAGERRRGEAYLLPPGAKELFHGW
jgi:hypothetical protein